MKRTIQRTKLYSIEQEYKKMATEQPGLFLLNERKINLFHEQNKMQLEVMHSRFIDIQSKYVQKDAEGNFMITGAGETQKWKFINSKADLINARVLDLSQVEEQFNKECGNFFSQNVTIEY